jgi:solute carrier family 35 protein E1
MTTTVVTGTGRRSSTRPSELQIPAKTSISHMTSPIDKFPPFSDEPFDTVAGQGEPQSSSTIRYAPRDLWEPRKAGAFTREHGNGSTRVSKHRPRKSISEAISTIRTRNASVSANAQELAQALRAPVSYQLIVRFADIPSRQIRLMMYL